MWKTLKSQKIFSHPRLTLLEDDVVLPSGKQTKYLKFEYRGDAACVICCQKDKILVQREYSYVPGKVMHQFPGGFIPVGESIEDGVRRELMEESGYQAGKLDMIGKYYFNHRRSSAIFYVFTTTEIKPCTSAKEDTELELEDVWLTAEEIDNLISGDELLSGEFVIAWSYYQRFNV